MAESINKFIRQRASHRGFITRIEGEIEALCGNLESKDIESELNHKLAFLERKSKDIESLDSQILDTLSESADIDREIEQSSEVTNQILKLIVQIKAALKRVVTNREPSALARGRTYDERVEVKAKLPELSLKEFDGDALHYQSFIETFNSSVHNNPSLNTIDKFSYLRSILRGTAAATISGLSLTEQNYEEALELLKARFGDKNVLVSKFVDALLQLEPVRSVEHVGRLREIYDKLESYLRNLKALGIDSAQFGPVMTPIILNKLPPEIRLEVTRKNTSEIWNFNEILKQLLIEISAREKCFMAMSSESTLDVEFERERFSGSSLTTVKSQARLKPVKDVVTLNHEECLFCGQRHRSWQCGIVTNAKARKEIIVKLKKCFICFKSGHVAKDCRSKFFCFHCKQRHNSALCESKDRLKLRPQTVKSTGEQADKSASLIMNAANSVLLQTATARVCDATSLHSEKARLLFDSASQMSYISRELANKLQSKPISRQAFIVQGFGGMQKKLADYEVVEVEVIARDLEKIRMSLYVTSQVCAPLQGQEVSLARERYEHLQGITLAEQGVQGGCLSIDILVGSDYYWKFVGQDLKRGKEGPVAVCSKLGWLLSGRLDLPNQTNYSTNTATVHVMKVSVLEQDSDPLMSEVRKFWEVESAGIISYQDTNVYQDFLDTIKYTGRSYEVSLPWKQNHAVLPDNYSMCVSRLTSVLRRLRTNPELLAKYDLVMSEQLAEGIVEEVPDDEVESCEAGMRHYVSHHPVIREEKTTTKLRIVYDASARVQGNLSLNDCLFKGPALTEQLFNVVLRFRLFPIAFIADIRQAFLMIGVEKADRDFLRFLWVKDIKSEVPEIIVRRFRTIVFGLNASPFLLNATLRTHLQMFNDDQIQKIIRSFYVDDFNSGAWEYDSAYDLFVKAREYLLRGGFQLRKFFSNDLLLQAAINTLLGEHGGSSKEFGIIEDKASYAKSNVGSSSTSDLKVLGVGWDTSSDDFVFEFGKVASQLRECSLTKRNLLSITTKFFDPLGLLCPVLLFLKLIFQDLCKTAVDWDEELCEDAKCNVNEWARNAESLPAVRFPRCVLPKARVDWIDIVGFSDASSKAYGACVYLRASVNEVVCVNLLTAKSRVAPIRSISVPRLELLGNVVLAKLVASVYNAISLEVPVRSVALFTDSTTCLWWINNNSNEYNPYVHNRVNEITSLFPADNWRYVQTYNNPADTCSRPSFLSEVAGNNLWRHGPEFLCNDETKWPKWEGVDAPIDSEEELKQSAQRSRQAASTLASLADSTYLPAREVFSVFDLSRFNDADALFRVTAIVFKFVERIRRRCKDTNVSTVEVTNAQTFWLRAMQALDEATRAEQFAKTKANLKLTKDKFGLYRCCGRIEHSSLLFGQKFPVYLPSESPITKLIISSAHNRVLHSGVEQTLTQIRKSYWIPRGRQIVRQFVRRCLICRRLTCKSYGQPTPAALPPFRVNGSLAFENIGVDFAGPLWCRDIFHRGELHKSYILVVTCALSRAVHLELTPNASAVALVRGLSRVFARRGDPKLSYSDNAKCFTSSDLKRFVKQRRIVWKHSLERSPWWNGFTERMVGMTKRVLRRVLGRARLNFEELSTALVAVEAIVNSRPLTYLSSDELDEPLTPSHLILGKRLLAPDYSPDQPQVDIESTDMVKRNKYLGNVLQHFWERWRNEYLVQLREHQRRPSSGAVEPQVGDVVLIKEEKTPRNQWQIGLVRDVIRGSDKVVRGAVVRLAGGSTVKRPCQLLYPVEQYSNSGSAPDSVNGQIERVEGVRPKRDAAITGQLVRKLAGHQ
jgi:transposase InsO family protein